MHRKRRLAFQFSDFFSRRIELRQTTANQITRLECSGKRLAPCHGRARSGWRGRPGTILSARHAATVIILLSRKMLAGRANFSATSRRTERPDSESGLYRRLAVGRASAVATRRRLPGSPSNRPQNEENGVFSLSLRRRRGGRDGLGGWLSRHYPEATSSFSRRPSPLPSARRPAAWYSGARGAHRTVSS